MAGEPGAGVRLERDGRGIARVTLDRARVHNAFDDSLIARLDEAFAALETDPAVRAVVLAAEGDSFSAGADLTWMRRMAGLGTDDNLADAMRLGELLRRVAHLPKPVIALVQGPAYGGGVGLVAAADIAIASERASFMLSEVRLGLVPAVISPYVVAAIGARQARRVFVTAERIDAAAALRLGLVHQVVPAAELEAAGARLLERLAANAPGAMAAAKELVFAVAGRAIDQALIADTARRIAEARGSREGIEGIAAFLDKRKPRWAGG
ncbi:MAG TPA: enoyl-CoA hydratase-related protein [Alphaproteobacteria bacterium]